MSAYKFVNEYFGGWDVYKFERKTSAVGFIELVDPATDVKVRVMLDMNGASNWEDSDVTASMVEGIR